MRARKPLVENDPRHGSRYCYIYFSCRCELCKTANAAEQRRMNDNRVARLSELKTHGTYASYTNWKCRCEPCKAAGKATNDAAAARRKASQS
jgi:hypothetical protein